MSKTKDNWLLKVNWNFFSKRQMRKQTPQILKRSENGNCKCLINPHWGQGAAISTRLFCIFRYSWKKDIHIWQDFEERNITGRSRQRRMILLSVQLSNVTKSNPNSSFQIPVFHSESYEEHMKSPTSHAVLLDSLVDLNREQSSMSFEFGMIGSEAGSRRADS